MRKRLPQPGDLLEIVLPDGRYAYAHYLMLDPYGGPLVKVLAGVFEDSLDPSSLDTRQKRFYTYVGINPPVRAGRWRIVGHEPPDPEDRPFFRSENIVRPSQWVARRAGEFPPEALSNPSPRYLLELEWDGVYAAEDVEERIMTGRGFACEEAMDDRLRGAAPEQMNDR